MAEVIADFSVYTTSESQRLEKMEVIKEGKPIDYVSTYGGSADDMASLVDIMDMVKKDCPIRTIGIGKVMSAGVLT